MGRRSRGKFRRVHARHVSIDEWLADGRAYARRQEVAAYFHATLREDVLPLIVDCIKSYDRHRRELRWWRRLWRAIQRRLLRVEVPPTPYLDDLRREIASEAAGEEDAAAAADDAQEDADARAPETDDDSPRPRTCVICGSATLEPVTEHGGLQCDRGHLIEAPPGEPGT